MGHPFFIVSVFQGALMRVAVIAVMLFVAALPAARAQVPPALDFTAITRAERASADCAITFDDGPGPHTGMLLDVLAAKKVKATFFVLGEHVRRYPDIIRRMVAEGHEVENHSWDHPDMRKLDEAQRQKEMSETVAELKSLGVTPHFFRPPYGSYDAALVDQARNQGMEVVLWTHDSVDWRYHSVAQMEGNVVPTGQGAHGIFLFHDIHDSTIAAMPAVLDELATKGCNFVTVARWVDDNDHPATPMVRPASAPAPAKSGLGNWLKALIQ